MIDLLNRNWLSITAPAIVFLAFLVVAIWARRALYNYLDRLFVKIKWEGSHTLTRTTKTPFFQWCVLLGVYTAVQISTLSPHGKFLTGRILGSIFVVSLTWTLILLAEKLLHLYLSGLKTVALLLTTVVINAVRIAFIIAGVLILLDIWGGADHAIGFIADYRLIGGYPGIQRCDTQYFLRT